jgi:hypothetical protein
MAHWISYHFDLLTRVWGILIMVLVAWSFWIKDREGREYYDWLDKLAKEKKR